VDAVFGGCWVLPRILWVPSVRLLASLRIGLAVVGRVFVLLPRWVGSGARPLGFALADLPRGGSL